MEKAEIGSKRVRTLARIIAIILVLAVNVACVAAIFSLVESGTAIPNIYMADFTQTGNTDNLNGTAYVSVEGTVANPSSLTAKNVTLIISIYAYYHIPPVNISTVNLGSVPGNSFKSFNVDAPYSSGYYTLFTGVDFGLLLSSRFDFGAGFYAIVLPMAVLLPTLDIYSAYRLGFFDWVRARKKVVAATVAWGTGLAIIVSLSYWLFYISAVGSYQRPGLDIWDWVSIFFLSVVVGALIVNLEAIVYGFVASLVLSTILEVVYAILFTWFSQGVSQSFSMVIPGLTFGIYLQSVIGGVFVTVVRMIFFVVPLFCLLGVFIGAFIRSIFDPTVDAF